MTARALRAACIAGILAAAAHPLDGQGRMALEVRGGASVPLDEFETTVHSDGTLEPSGSFGVAFHLQRGMGFAFVLGFSQYRATCGGPGCAPDDRWISTQWEVGTRWMPLRGRVSPWLQAAAVIPRVEQFRGTSTRVSTTSFGLEGGGGLSIGMTQRWALVPAVRWTHFDADLPDAGVVPVTFLAADLALRVVF